MAVAIFRRESFEPFSDESHLRCSLFARKRYPGYLFRLRLTGYQFKERFTGYLFKLRVTGYLIKPRAEDYPGSVRVMSSVDATANGPGENTRYRGTSLIKNNPPLGPYRIPVRRDLWWS